MIVPYDAINLSTVALLAEGVDRNRTVAEARTRIAVALLAEGVDRNSDLPERYSLSLSSPSSRRAWIEIVDLLAGNLNDDLVALLAEGVDRNHIPQEQ